MKQILRAFFNLFNWNHRCRELDLQILWPECVAGTPTLDHAKATFALHAYNDPAWIALGPEEIARRIVSLTENGVAREPVKG